MENSEVTNTSPSSGSDPSDEIVNSESVAVTSSAATIPSSATTGAGDGPSSPATSSSSATGVGDGPPTHASSSATATTGDGPPECPICLQPSVHPVKLPCGHTFCFLCIKGVALRDPERKCALCRAAVPDSVFLNPPIQNATQLAQLVTTTATPSGYQWWYESRTGGWWQYDERAMNELERIFTSNQPTCQLSIAGRMFEINFQQMTQYPVNSPNLARRIRREISIPQNERLGIAGIPLDPSSGSRNTGIPAPPLFAAQGTGGAVGGSDDEEDYDMEDDNDGEDNDSEDDDAEEAPAAGPAPRTRVTIRINGRTLSGAELDPVQMAALPPLISAATRAASALMTDMERSIRQVGALLNTVTQLCDNWRPVTNRRPRRRTDPEDEDTAEEPAAENSSSNRDRSRSPR